MARSVEHSVQDRRAHTQSSFDETTAFMRMVQSCVAVTQNVSAELLTLKRTNSRKFLSPGVSKSNEHSAPNRRAQVRGSSGEKPPCTLMAPGACKIRRGCNVLQVPIQIIFLGVPKQGKHLLRVRGKYKL